MTVPTRIAFTLAQPLQLLNPMLRTHWARRRRYLASLSKQVWEAIIVVPGQRLPEIPFSRAVIKVVRKSTGIPDPDNLHASVKSLRDVLQPATAKRSYGLGIIANDSAACLGDGVDIRAERVAHRGEQGTDVLIEGTA